MAFRLVNIPIKNLDKKLVVIIEISRFNSYDNNMILKLVHSKSGFKIIGQLVYLLSRGEQKVILWPIFYFTAILNALIRIFRNVGIALVTSKSNNLKNLLCSSKDTI